MELTDPGRQAMLAAFMESLKPDPGQCLYCGAREEVIETKLGPLCGACNMKAIAHRLEGIRPFGTMYVGLYTRELPGESLEEASGAGYARQPVQMLEEGYGAAKGAHPVMFQAQADWMPLQGYFLAQSRAGEPLMVEEFDQDMRLSQGSILKVSVRLEFG